MKNLVLVVALTLMATVAMAEIVTVEFIGSVEYNQINQGVFADVNSGDSVHATFTLEYPKCGDYFCIPGAWHQLFQLTGTRIQETAGLFLLAEALETEKIGKIARKF